MRSATFIAATAKAMGSPIASSLRRRRRGLGDLGSILKPSQTCQLVINTGATIVSVLMVF